jgi:hypothetical protein
MQIYAKLHIFAFCWNLDYKKQHNYPLCCPYFAAGKVLPDLIFAVQACFNLLFKKISTNVERRAF